MDTETAKVKQIGTETKETDGRTEQKGCCVVAGQLCAGRLGSEGPAKVTSLLLGLGRELSNN